VLYRRSHVIGLEAANIMQIKVAETDWGEARIEDIQLLLEDVASQLLRHFESAPSGSILVSSQAGQEFPQVLYRENSTQVYTVLLSVNNRLWSRFSYQFAHELCHIISGYERLRLRPNQWFHEALCELASLFVLRQMSVTWQSFPPYSNWVGYAESLGSYAEEILVQPENSLPVGISLQEWFAENEPYLRNDPYRRNLNSLVAAALLPIVEAQPHMWRSIQFMPDTDASFGDFLSQWFSRCPGPYKTFIAEIGDMFGVSYVSA